MRVPWNMGSVFRRVQEHIEEAGATDPATEIVLRHDISLWQSEHLFAVLKADPPSK